MNNWLDSLDLNINNLNDLLIPGVYRKRKTHLVSNIPEELKNITISIILVFYSGSLDNTNKKSSYGHCQVIITSKKGIYYRTSKQIRDSNNNLIRDWNEWTKIAIEDNINKQIFQIPNTGSQLKNNQDLNTLGIGFYKKTNSNSWLNYPKQLSSTENGVPFIANLWWNTNFDTYNYDNIIDENNNIITPGKYTNIQIIITRSKGIFYRYKYGPAADEWDDWLQILPIQNSISINHPDTGKLKKAIQQLRQEWTALHDMPIWKDPNDPPEKRYFRGGIKYQGIPYSGMLRLDGDMGFSRKISTFYSAINNPTSIMYAENKAHGGAQSTNYGFVCSSLVPFLLGHKIQRGTSVLQEDESEPFEFYDYTGPNSIQIGDCLLTPLELEKDDIHHIILIYDIEVDPTSYQPVYIDLIEEVGSGSYTGNTSIKNNTWTKISKLTIKEFEEKLNPANKEYYKLGRYKEQNIIDIEPVRYAQDIYPDLGDQTYYKDDQEIWFYIPDNTITTLYYKREQDNNWKKVLLKDLEKKTVTRYTHISKKKVVENSYIVYKINNLITKYPIKDRYTTYLFTTKTGIERKRATKCKITYVHIGELKINVVKEKEVTTIYCILKGYSDNLTPIWAAAQFVSNPVEPGTLIWPAAQEIKLLPEGARNTKRMANSHQLINNNNSFIDPEDGQKTFNFIMNAHPTRKDQPGIMLTAFLDTGFGQVHICSDIADNPNYNGN